MPSGREARDELGSTQKRPAFGRRAATKDPARRPKHALVLPPEERGRRVRWRLATIGLYLLLQVGALLLAQRWDWYESLVIPAVAIPYWAVTRMIWSYWGPEMPSF